MSGRVIGILTRNFKIYYNLITALKEQDVAFQSLSFNDEIPGNIGVVITTRDELPEVNFKKVVIADIGVQFAVHMAKKLMDDREFFKELVIGIDPGRRPGVAVVGDGTVLHTAQAKSPEDVLRLVEIAVLMYPADTVLARIGHGSPTERNRIINSLAPLRIQVEIVNEDSTTNKRSPTADTDAAIEISFSRGYPAKKKYEVSPTTGEIRDIQRRSRIYSGGEITISGKLAHRVATGRLSLERALQIQKKQKRKKNRTAEAGDT